VAAKKILVLGLGNEIMSDDGIGPRLIKDLTGMFDNPLLEFKTASCGGLEVMELLPGFETAVLIDAIHTRDGKPGDVYYFRPSDFRETSNLSNLHDLNFLTALRLARVLDLGIPSDLHIIAVEIYEDLVFGESLTPVLNKRYPEALTEVHGILEKILN
jgi:hydrogenase maturation protease